MRSVVQIHLGPPTLGAVAQLGERLVCNQEATGSIPVSSTTTRRFLRPPQVGAAAARSAALQLKTATDEATLAIGFRMQRRPIGSVKAITGSAPGLIDNRIDPRKK